MFGDLFTMFVSFLFVNSVNQYQGCCDFRNSSFFRSNSCSFSWNFRSNSCSFSWNFRSNSCPTRSCSGPSGTCPGNTKKLETSGGNTTTRGAAKSCYLLGNVAKCWNLPVYMFCSQLEVHLYDLILWSHFLPPSFVLKPGRFVDPFNSSTICCNFKKIYYI